MISYLQVPTIDDNGHIIATPLIANNLALEWPSRLSYLLHILHCTRCLKCNMSRRPTLRCARLSCRLFRRTVYVVSRVRLSHVAQTPDVVDNSWPSLSQTGRHGLLLSVVV